LDLLSEGVTIAMIETGACIDHAPVRAATSRAAPSFPCSRP